MVDELLSTHQDPVKEVYENYGISIHKVENLIEGINVINDNDIALFDLDGTLFHNLTFFSKHGIEFIRRISNKLAVTNRSSNSYIIDGIVNRKTLKTLQKYGITSTFFHQDRQNKNARFRNMQEFNNAIDLMCHMLGPDKSIKKNICLIADMGTLNRILYKFLNTNEINYMIDLKMALEERGYKNLNYQLIEIIPNFKYRWDKKLQKLRKTLKGNQPSLNNIEQ